MVAENFTVIAVALDENVAAVIPFADGITYPVLVDTEHQMSEIYAISNVPTVVWIDEDDRIVRPNAREPGIDMFTEVDVPLCNKILADLDVILEAANVSATG